VYRVVPFIVNLPFRTRPEALAEPQEADAGKPFQPIEVSSPFGGPVLTVVIPRVVFMTSLPQFKLARRPAS
jgi:hypothetical protein